MCVVPRASAHTRRLTYTVNYRRVGARGVSGYSGGGGVRLTGMQCMLKGGNVCATGCVCSMKWNCNAVNMTQGESEYAGQSFKGTQM